MKDGRRRRRMNPFLGPDTKQISNTLFGVCCVLCNIMERSNTEIYRKAVNHRPHLMDVINKHIYLYGYSYKHLAYLLKQAPPIRALVHGRGGAHGTATNTRDAWNGILESLSPTPEIRMLYMKIYEFFIDG